ncbi:Gag-pol polyprotein, partial [Operophtera brumata]
MPVENKQRYKELITKRVSAKGQITKFKNYLNSISTLTELNNIQLTELNLKLAKFEALSVRFDDLQNEIEVLDPENISTEIDERDSMEQDIIVNIATAKNLVEVFSKKVESERRSSAHDQLPRESERSLRFLVDHVTKNLRALTGLGQPTDKWDVLIIFMLSSKLDSSTLLKWEECRNSLEGDVPSLGQFSKFLIDRADVLEALNRNRSDNNNSKPPMPPMRSAPNNNNNYANQRQVCEQNATIVDYSNQQTYNGNDDLVDGQNTTIVNYSNQNSSSQVLLSTAMIEVSNPFSQQK